MQHSDVEAMKNLISLDLTLQKLYFLFSAETYDCPTCILSSFQNHPQISRYKPGCNKSREQNVLSVPWPSLRVSRLTQNGDQSSLSLYSTRQHGKNRGESLGRRTFRPPIPPHVPRASPAGSFLRSFAVFSQTCSKCLWSYFFFISSSH